MKKLVLLFSLLVFSLLSYAQPANDDPCAAIELPVDTSCNYLSFSNVGATGTSGITAPNCSYYNNTDVWFFAVVPASGHLIVSSQAGSLNDSGMEWYLSSGGCSGTFTSAGCDDDGGPGFMSELEGLCFSPGDTVWIRFWDYAGFFTGTFSLCAVDGGVGGAAPVNDTPCGAILINPGSSGQCIPQTFDNLCATDFAGAPAPGCAEYKGQDVWFKTVVPASGQLFFQAAPGSIDNGGMAIYSGSGCGGPFSLIECDDFDGPGAMPQIIRQDFTPGDTLWIRFWSYFGGSGTFDLCVYDASPRPCATCGGCMESFQNHAYTEGVIGCDDCSSASIPLGFPFTICGNTFTHCYINANGNLTFTQPLASYTPSGFPNNSTALMVAPFWADVDVRTCGWVYHQAASGRFVVTWADVGYYHEQCSALNSFQLILTDGSDPSVGVGNNVAFYYGDMQWTTGERGGSGGFGSPAAVSGVNLNDGSNFNQFGTFDRAGTSFDGAGGTADGVDWLDGKCFRFLAGNCSLFPFDLLELEAVRGEEGEVWLNWQHNPQGKLQYAVERSRDGLEFLPLGELYAEGSGALQSFQFSDPGDDLAGSLWYRIRVMEEDGSWEYSPVVNLAPLQTDSRFELWPNPVGEGNAFHFRLWLPKAGTVLWTLSDLAGRGVETGQNSFPAGNAEGEIRTPVSPGIYLFKLILPDGKVTTKKLLVN